LNNYGTIAPGPAAACGGWSSAGGMVPQLSNCGTTSPAAATQCWAAGFLEQLPVVEQLRNDGGRACCRLGGRSSAGGMVPQLSNCGTTSPAAATRRRTAGFLEQLPVVEQLRNDGGRACCRLGGRSSAGGMVPQLSNCGTTSPAAATQCWAAGFLEQLPVVEQLRNDGGRACCRLGGRSSARGMASQLNNCGTTSPAAAPRGRAAGSVEQPSVVEQLRKPCRGSGAAAVSWPCRAAERQLGGGAVAGLFRS